MDVCGAPARDLSAAMEQHYHQSNHAGVVDLDPGILVFPAVTSRAKRWKKANSTRTLRESTEAVGDRAEHLAHSGEVIESFLHQPGSNPERLDYRVCCLDRKKQTGSSSY